MRSFLHVVDLASMALALAAGDAKGEAAANL